MRNNNYRITGIALIFLEVLLLFAFFSFAPQGVLAGVGNPTESLSNLTIANSFPEVYNISINSDAPISLIPNSTKLTTCTAIVVDWNGDIDIDSANATFFSSSSLQSDPDDNNNHYTNSSCQINTTYISYGGDPDDAYKALVNCTFQIFYYADPENWNCTIQVNDTVNNMGTESDQETISELLALGLPGIIQYGTVNATSVSDEQEINVTNYGNTKVNISLEGYGANPNDGNAMNCTFGATKNISAELEKYNLSTSTSGQVSLTEFEASYINLTTTPEVKQFNLTSRISDISEDTAKPTYWRIYVPKGVAGTCTGNIVFGATTAAGS